VRCPSGPGTAGPMERPANTRSSFSVDDLDDDSAVRLGDPLGGAAAPNSAVSSPGGEVRDWTAER
ncbi:MAG: hypothetical protein ACYDC5_12825, partial [Candidatus Dormibacteria bacterium]